MNPTLLCVGCGYDLRGLDDDGACPECGTAVARSRRGEALSAADPEWLRRVWRGLLLFAVGCVLLILWFPLFVWAVTFAGDLKRVTSAMVEIGNVAYGLTAMVLTLAGIIGVTVLDPRRAQTEQPVARRRIARGAAALAIVMLVLREALRLAGGGLALSATLLRSTEVVLAALLVVAVVTSTYELARIVERVPDLAKAKRMRSYAKGFVIGLVLCAAGNAISSPFRLTSGLASGTAVVLGVGGGLMAFASAVGLVNAWWEAREILRQCLFKASIGEV